VTSTSRLSEIILGEEIAGGELYNAVKNNNKTKTKTKKRTRPTV